uniref:Uncharacterized protein n=1 Tax=Anguilla anguilla TaxID=7936 RepID=A0A0E9TQF4_ANGAN
MWVLDFVYQIKDS